MKSTVRYTTMTMAIIRTTRATTRKQSITRRAAMKTSAHTTDGGDDDAQMSSVKSVMHKFGIL
eukprot:365347-Chlamydomonas_euryale.AAC.13